LSVSFSKIKKGPGIVAHTYNLSYMGDGVRRIVVQGKSRQKKLERSHLKEQVRHSGAYL
jgi:hypothetical protein